MPAGHIGPHNDGGCSWAFDDRQRSTKATIYDVGAEARKLVKMADDLLSSDLVMYDHTREFLTEVRDSSKEFLRMEGHFNE